MKQNKGITLISLAITIIVIGILAGVIIYAGTTILKEAKLQTINTDMLLIEAKAETIYEKLSFEKQSSELEAALPGEKVESGSNDAGNLSTAGVSSDEILDYHVWKQEVLDSNGLQGIKLVNNEKFYVKYGDEIEVVSSIGYTHTDGKIYYKLSDIKYLQVESEI